MHILERWKSFIRSLVCKHTMQPLTHFAIGGEFEKGKEIARYVREYSMCVKCTHMQVVHYYIPTYRVKGVGRSSAKGWPLNSKGEPLTGFPNPTMDIKLLECGSPATSFRRDCAHQINNLPDTLRTLINGKFQKEYGIEPTGGQQELPFESGHSYPR